MKKLFFLCFLFFLIQGPAIASVRTNSYGRYCIPPEEAVINDIIPGMGVEAIFKLPPAVSTEATAAEDDGGFYAISIFRFPGLEVQIVRDTVDVVTTDSREITWTGGTKIGMPRSAIHTIIGKAAVVQEKEEEQYLTCVEEGDVYAILHYKADQLTRIELVMDRP